MIRSQKKGNKRFHKVLYKEEKRQEHARTHTKRLVKGRDHYEIDFKPLKMAAQENF